MIRFVTPELEALFCEKSVQFGIFGAKIYSQYQTYGAQSGILDMWLLFDDTYVTGCVSRFGGLLTAACTPRADVEELAVFLRAVGGRADIVSRNLGAVGGTQPQLAEIPALRAVL